MWPFTIWWCVSSKKKDAQQNCKRTQKSNTHTIPLNDGHKKRTREKNTKKIMCAHLFGAVKPFEHLGFFRIFKCICVIFISMECKIFWRFFLAMEKNDFFYLENNCMISKYYVRLVLLYWSNVIALKSLKFNCYSFDMHII